MPNLTLLSGSFVGGPEDARTAIMFFEFPDGAIVSLRLTFVHPQFRRVVPRAN